ncbi:MAG: fumarate reductase/succinate dehydrogenase flavoprotein subunit [Cyanobacteria bacterium SW_9_44_58]|nr:MAG: fumarate reductase/succinate dehydrogenase flavoprotein subunit [Cyanobacteria bacterium SW_9_44_58]
MKLESNIPSGSLPNKWDNHKFNLKLVNPANKRNYHILVVGTGLAGSSAAASLAEMGYQVSCFCYQDSPRRAHSIAAQGGINAAKNYQNDGDSVYRLFYDTIKGGDYRSREANVYRLAQVSVNIIDQMVAQGVPFAREYGGLLTNRSFGGAQVSRTFYARGQTGQQLLLAAYQQLNRQIAQGQVKMYSRHEMLELVVVDGHAKGIVTRNLVTGKIERWAGDCVVLCTGGYGNVYFLSTNAQGCNVTATYRAYCQGAGFANPCYTQIHPTCIPVQGDQQSKLTLMSESLRNDGRIWVPNDRAIALQIRNGKLSPHDVPESARDYYLERKYPSFGNLAPRDIASRAAKEVCDEGRGVAPTGFGVFLDFRDAIARLGEDTIAERYGNLFEMYNRITGNNPYQTPMMIYPAVHYTMGGLWVDYNLQSNLPGLFVAGEANFSDHGANRLGASALMQGLADGYFILPYTIGHYLAGTVGISQAGKATTDAPEFDHAEQKTQDKIKRLLDNKGRGKESPRHFHKRLGEIMWHYCGMSRSKEGLEKALNDIATLRENFWRHVKVVGIANSLNQELERAGRVADFIDFGELMCRDALMREESCGSHFRVEHQYGEEDEEVKTGFLSAGEAKRNDQEYAFVGVWEYQGDKQPPKLRKEPLIYEEVDFSTRSYR